MSEVIASTKAAAENTVKAPTTREPNPVIVIAAFTESMKVLLGEIRGLASEAFSFQLKMMELMPEADRITAFKAVLDTHSVEVASDERIALALVSMVEKMGGHAANIIPAAIMLRQTEISERRAEYAKREEERIRREAEEAEREEERKALSRMRVASAYSGGEGYDAAEYEVSRAMKTKSAK